MIKKVCPHCRKASYSASDRGTWVCPYCGNDLTEQSVKTAELLGRRKQKT